MFRCLRQRSRIPTVPRRNAAQELGVKAELDKLALVLTADEMDAVHVIIDAMVRMAGAPNDKMIDGGNAVFFQTVNNVIDNCGGLRRWFEGVRPAMPPRSSTGTAQSVPLPYLSRAILERSGKLSSLCRGRYAGELRTNTPKPTGTRPRRETTDFFVKQTPDAGEPAGTGRCCDKKAKSRQPCCATSTAITRTSESKADDRPDGGL